MLNNKVKTTKDYIYIVYSKKTRLSNKGAEEYIYQLSTEYDLNIRILTEELIVFKDRDILYKNNILSKPKIVYFRSYNDKLMRLFSDISYVINSFELNNTTRDKYNIYKLLSNSNINHPITFKYTNHKYEDITLNKPFILKQSYSSKGDKVFLINTKDDYNKALLSLELEHTIIQEFIKESYGKDIRVLLIGNKCEGVIMRDNKDDFRSNISLGASSYIYSKDNDYLIELSNKISSLLKAEILSVDFLIKEDTYYLCEVNAIPGFKIYYNNNLDPIRTIIIYIKNLLNKL